MLLSVLSKFIASILVSLLSLSIITSVLSDTLLSSKYLEGQLAKTNSYSRLSGAIITETSKNNDSNDPNFQTELGAVVTPTYVQQKVNSGLDQFESYYNGSGTTPTIDMSDFVTRARAAGIDIKSDGNNPFSEPITLSGGSQIQGIGKVYSQVRLDAIIASAVLLLVLVGLSWERHRFAAVPDVLIIVGIMIGLLAAFFSLAPGLAVHYLKIDFNSNAFAPIARDLATSISHNIGMDFTIIAVVSFLVGLVSRIWLGKKKLTGVSARQKFVKDFGSTPVAKPAAGAATRSAVKR